MEALPYGLRGLKYMDFVDQIKALSLKIPNLVDHVQNEGVTRSALVEPFIRALGYDPSDPTEVLPEFGANVDVPGNVRDRRVDYGILRDGQPIILIECKHHSCNLDSGFAQLFNYFTPTAARIGILTNGLIYKFFADVDKPGVMDKKPFLELDMLNLQMASVAELKRLSKPIFNVNEFMDTAIQLKYIGGIKNLLQKQLTEPDETFVKFFFDTLCPENRFRGILRDNFIALTPRSFREFIREQIDSILKEVSEFKDFKETPQPEQPQPIPPTLQDGIETTVEELEGYYIVKSILYGLVEPERIAYVDRAGFFSILLDGKVGKPLCRLYFNNPNSKKIGLFDNGGGRLAEEKIAINSLNEIFQYADRIKATVPHYPEK